MLTWRQMDLASSTCFNCLGSVRPQDTGFHPKGILRCKHFQKLVSGDVSAVEPITYIFFGCDYIDDDSVASQLDTIFNMARQKISRLQRCVYKADTKFSVETSDRFWILRKEINEFFSRIHVFVKRKIEFYNVHQDVDVIRQLLRNISDLVIYMGTINNLPHHVTSCMSSSQGNKCLSITYHFSHMNLDVRWSLLTIFHDLSLFLEGNPHLQIVSFFPKSIMDHISVESASPFEQYLFFVLWDVVAMTLNIFRKIKLPEYTSISTFPCSCFKELFVLIRKLLDRRYEQNNKDSFWVTLHRIFQVILQDKEGQNSYLGIEENEILDSTHITLIPNLSGINKLGFCWWLLVHLAPLYEVDDCGKIDIPNQVSYKSNWFEVANLCRLATQSEAHACTETQLRCYLRCCLSLSQRWEASMDVPLLLWEYFYKRLDDAFMDAGEVTALGFGKTGLALFKHIQLLTSDVDEFNENFTSYQLFLRLLSLQLKSSLSTGSQKEWRNLKGRIFSKFHPRKIKELNVSGLQNCFCLFLVMATLSDLEDVGCKICDLLEMISPQIIDNRKHSLIWRILFALMLIHEKEEKSLALPAQQMANNFNSFTSEFSAGLIDRHLATELLNVYLLGVKDVFEHSKGLILSEYIVIASSLHDLLNLASPCNIQLALSVVEIMLSRQRIIHQRRLIAANAVDSSVDEFHLEALVEAFWLHIVPFVKEQAVGEANFKLVADVASGITILLADKPPKPVVQMQESLASMLEDFGFGPNVRAKICCEYLANLLSQPDVLIKIERRVPNCQAKFVRSWARLGIQTSNETHDLTRLILGLPEMKKIFVDARHELPNTDRYFDVMGSFLKALNARQNTLEFNSRIAAKQTVAFYFADIIKVSNVNFKGNNSPEMLSSVYTMVGGIMGTIPSLIYVPSKDDCIFCEIVNTIILPHAIYNPDIALHPNLQAALREHLPQVIHGIATLNFKRDPYIKQTLKNVFTHYLPRFSMKGSESGVHPLVVAMVSAVRSLPNGSDMVHFAIEVVRDAYLLKRGKPLQLGINFIHEFFISCSPKECASTSRVLLPPLLKLLLLEELSTRQAILDVMKLVIDCCLAQEDETCRSSVQDTLKDLIRQQFNSHADRMFNLLRTLAKLYLESIGSLVPFLAEQVNETERIQGCGTNGALRSKLREFVLDIEDGFKRQRQDR